MGMVGTRLGCTPHHTTPHHTTPAEHGPQGGTRCSWVPSTPTIPLSPSLLPCFYPMLPSGLRHLHPFRFSLFTTIYGSFYSQGMCSIFFCSRFLIWFQLVDS
ncbi:hypothetical protein KC19_11G001000 [Ceratodon purpureus]|uniref:Uncharacterized protein n=1 Tax=Ceratodon purpureus TaxID=3225 RepID=A0A8T0G8W1_CERPU|nr:hypothetical protein KC19_11G001000 [Ceratodon purpureus]